jgi:hypothetical protein
MSDEQKKYYLVNLGEDSQLKVDLNRGVASLWDAAESHFRPHLCLNGKEGVEVLKRLSQDPDGADTEFWAREHLIVSGDDIWLNIKFIMFLDRICFPSNVANLSPRQTGYVVKALPAESRTAVLKTIKEWYFEKFLEDMKKGIETISKQFDEGDPFIESDDGNRIFDIHGGRHMDVPYTEWGIVGEELAPPFLFGFTCFDHMGENDGYGRADAFLSDVDSQRKSAVDGLIGLVRALK